MKYTYGYLLIIFVALLLLPSVYADLGPKPTVDISVYYNNQLVSGQFNAVMLQCYKNASVSNDYTTYLSGKSSCMSPECQGLYNLTISDNECYWAPSMFAWGGDCSNGVCNFHYFPPSRFRLGIYVPSLGQIITTPAIDRLNFASTYDVRVSSDGKTSIKETTPILTRDSVKSFIPALIITIILELIVALIFALRKGWPKKLLWYVFLANVISLPIVWFVIPLFRISIVSSGWSFILTLVLYEAFAFIFEAYFLYWTNKEFLDLKNAFKLSVVMNLVSLVLGGILYALIILAVG